MKEKIVKEKACFKSSTDPSCIDLFLTNFPSGFQNTCAITAGLFDFHKMVITAMKMTFQKNPPNGLKNLPKNQPDMTHMKKPLCSGHPYMTDTFYKTVGVHYMQI